MYLDELIRLDSQNPGTDYAGITDFLEKRLLDAGASVLHVGKNLFAKWGKPELLLNAHMDTVKAAGWKSNPLEPVARGGRVFGLGSADTKGNIHAVLQAIKSGPDDLAVLFSVDEEFGARTGVQAFAETRLLKGLRRAIVLEPTDNKVVTSHPGYYAFELAFSGRAGHSSLAAKNAVLNACESVSALSKHFGTRFSAGKISSNSGDSSATAGECVATVSVRAYDGYRTVTSAVRQLSPSARVKALQAGPPFNNPLPFIPGNAEAGFWTDAAILSERGLNAVVYGAGSVSQAHAPGESVSLSSIKKCESFIQTAIGEYS